MLHLYLVFEREISLSRFVCGYPVILLYNIYSCLKMLMTHQLINMLKFVCQVIEKFITIIIQSDIISLDSMQNILPHVIFYSIRIYLHEFHESHRRSINQIICSSWLLLSKSTTLNK